MERRIDYTKHFIILNEKDMRKLIDGRPTFMEGSVEDNFPNTVIVTEKGYKNLMDFWGDDDK